MRDSKIFTPAKVKYTGINTNEFTHGELYDAYFLEYWQGIRNSLHVRDNSGKITDYNSFKNFEIISDPENVLNRYEAIVECITHKYDNEIGGITFGKKYKAIGRDKDGHYLIMDDTFDCYFYSPDYFKIISDEHGILNRQSVYYSFFNVSDR